MAEADAIKAFFVQVRFGSVPGRLAKGKFYTRVWAPGCSTCGPKAKTSSLTSGGKRNSTESAKALPISSLLPGNSISG
ncbi:unnamed protein product, partial [Mesorhabditis spiculigera]